MANALFDKAREAFLNGNLNLTTDDIRVVLVDTALYTFSAGHEFLGSIPAGARVATSAAGLTSKSTTDGVFDADEVTFSALTGDSIEAVVLYQHTGNDATARLILWIDEGNFPIVPNGGDQTLVWSTGPNRIFRI